MLLKGISIKYKVIELILEWHKNTSPSRFRQTKIKKNQGKIYSLLVNKNKKMLSFLNNGYP